MKELAFDTSAYNCIGVLLAIAARKLNTSYEMIGKGAWTFEFDQDEDGAIGERILVNHKIDPLSSLEKYHNLQVKRHAFEKETFTENIQFHLAKGTPIIINTDAYWCSWSMAYQKKYILHSFMVDDYIEETQEFNCVDPYITFDLIKTKLEDIELGIRDIMTVHLISKEIDKKELFYALKEDNDYIQDKSQLMFKSMHEFGKQIEFVDFENECQGNDETLFAVPLFSCFRNLMASRRNYSYVLKYLSEVLESPELVDISDTLFSLSRQWEILNSKLIISYKRNKRDLLNKISNEIYLISEKEKEMSNILNEFVQNELKCYK